MDKYMKYLCNQQWRFLNIFSGNEAARTETAENSDIPAVIGPAIAKRNSAFVR